MPIHFQKENSIHLSKRIDCVHRSLFVDELWTTNYELKPRLVGSKR